MVFLSCTFGLNATSDIDSTFLKGINDLVIEIWSKSTPNLAKNLMVQNSKITNSMDENP